MIDYIKNFTKKKVQAHNPFRHKEHFYKFTEELTKQRDYFKNMPLSSNMEDEKENLKVMADMYYVYVWIIKHHPEALAFVKLFDAIHDGLVKFCPDDLIIKKASYDESKAVIEKGKRESQDIFKENAAR